MMRHALSDVRVRRIGRCTLATVVLVVMSALNHLEADTSYPYTAFVAARELAVRSGPGEEFYETERLPAGTAVEVYRHADDAWCAIRPTVDSFSWVAAEHLEILDNPSLARVINVPAKTRVGSKFSDVHDVEYVSLRAGEVVELLGTKLLREASGEASRRWFKIAPPSGEFRWVSARGLSRNAITGTARIEEDEPPATPKPKSKDLGSGVATTIQTHPIRSDSILDANPGPEENTGFSSTGSSVRQAAYEQAPAGAEAVDAAEEQDSTHVNAVTWTAVGTPTDILTAPEPRSYLDRYNALNVLLSRAVLAEIQTWDFQDVRAQAVLLRDAAAEPDETKMAESLLTKIDDFESLRRRHDKLSDPPHEQEASAVAEGPAPLPALADAPIVDVPTDMPKLVTRRPPETNPAGGTNLRHRDEIDNSVFDATGVLISVRSRRSDMPRYALTDSSGQVTRFVSTSNGDTLSPFLNKRVGIIGEAGFLRRLNKPHVVASKVVHLTR